MIGQYVADHVVPERSQAEDEYWVGLEPDPLNAT